MIFLTTVALACSLQVDLFNDEGKRLCPYLDQTSHWIVGIGHLVLDEDSLEERDCISEKECQELFRHDLGWALKACGELWPEFDRFPFEVKRALVNLVFCKGSGNMPNFRKVVAKKNWPEAADFLRNKFRPLYWQTGQRAERIEARIRKAASQ